MASQSGLADVLDDLCVRFLNNLPASEYETFDRLFFAVEAAHWFYEDFHREENTRLPKLPLSAFAKLIFAHSPMLQPYAGDVEELTAGFKKYKQEVPTYGAAMLNPDMTKVLLVCGWGKNGKWGFPKGKIAKDESELDAAIREVFEETGFDFSTVLPKEGESPVYADSYVGGRLSRVFIVPDVPESTKFETRTRKEISEIRWVPIVDLPDPRDKAGDGAVVHKHLGQLSPKSFWLVRQYVPRIKSVIKKRSRDSQPVASGQQGVGRPAGLAKGSAGSAKGSAGSAKGSAGSAKGLRQKKAGTSGKANKSDRGGGCGRNARDEETFGGASLGASAFDAKAMSTKERDDFFLQYITEADRRKAELGTGDDFWPVPYVTAKDFGPAPSNGDAFLPNHPNREHERDTGLATGHDRRDVLVGSSSQQCATLFCFDRSQILACLQ